MEPSNAELPLALGTLTLSHEGRPDRLEAVTLLRFALGQGIRILDTAPSYCRDQADFHYGEHLVREAVASLGFAQSDVCILTKVGMLRTGGKWIPCGRPEHLRQSVEGSLAALGQQSLRYLLLHVRDPAVPFDETLSALAELQKEGLVTHLGLCNTSIADLETASQYFPVALVQNEFSLSRRAAAENGLIELTGQRGIPFFAHRPLGGHAAKSNRIESFVLQSLAERHQCTVSEISLAALRTAGHHVIPLVGASRLSSVRSSLRAMRITIDVSDQTALSLEFPLTSAAVAMSKADAGDTSADISPVETPDVVLVMGIQGAGKSERVNDFVNAGYARLNRDEAGGSLEDLIPRLAELLKTGAKRVVLDNTYPTCQSRFGVIRVAAAAGVPVRCVFMDTPVHEAWQNIAARMVSRYGVPLGPVEMKLMRKFDPNLPPPFALQRWLQTLERPSRSEGFSQVAVVSFVRRPRPDQQGKGLLLDVDGTLRKTISGQPFPAAPDDQTILPGRHEVLMEWVNAGYRLFFVSNQAGIALGQTDAGTVQAAMFRTVELLNVPVTEITFCAHPSKPVECFCRKPMPGLGVYLIEKYGLDREQLVMVGDRDSDREFAANLGIRYFDEQTFFVDEARPHPT